MGRKMVSVETLHGYSIGELAKIKNKFKDSYGYTVLSIVIGRFQGVTTEELTKKYKKSKPTVIDYIHKWNELGIEALVDNRGGSVGTFTDDMLETIRYAIENEAPSDYGFDSPTWTISMFAKLIEKKYNKQYSYEWIRKVVKENNYVYKKPSYKCKYSEIENRELFRKSLSNSRFFRSYY